MLRSGRAGQERLKILGRARRVDTIQLLVQSGVRPGMRCLDLGCGGGSVTFELASLVGPEGSVVGVDMDAVRIALARGEARDRGHTNVEFRIETVDEWNEVDAYDLVYCRFLLQHLANPAGLLGRMWGAVRPEGVLAVEDADFDGCFSYPDNEGLAFFKRVFPLLLERRGGDARIGRKLYRYLWSADIPNPDVRVVQDVNATGAAKSLLLRTLEEAADPIVRSELAGVAEVGAAIDALSFTVDQRTVVGGPRVFQVWAKRAG